MTRLKTHSRSEAELWQNPGAWLPSQDALYEAKRSLQIRIIFFLWAGIFDVEVDFQSTCLTTRILVLTLSLPLLIWRMWGQWTGQDDVRICVTLNKHWNNVKTTFCSCNQGDLGALRGQCPPLRFPVAQGLTLSFMELDTWGLCSTWWAPIYPWRESGSLRQSAQKWSLIPSFKPQGQAILKPKAPWMPIEPSEDVRVDSAVTGVWKHRLPRLQGASALLLFIGVWHTALCTAC